MTRTDPRTVTTGLRNNVVSLFLMLPCAFAVLSAPATAMAQDAQVELRSLLVSSDGGLQPGARLTFRVAGTPRATVVVRLQGVKGTIPLRELSPGLFIGRYTVKRGDRIAENSEVRANLRVGKRSSSASNTLAEVMRDQGPVVMAPPAQPAPPAAPAPDLRIERFGVAPFDRIEPGAELRFALDGMPGATVNVALPGVANDVGLRELRPGHYEGSYTLRRADNLNPTRPVVATLRQGNRVATANLMLPQAQPQPQPAAVAVPVNLPLQITSHGSNAQVAGGSTRIEGRTAPFASVAATVEASAPVPGGLSVAQQIFSQTVQADGTGQFSFSFSPRFIIPGARYTVALTATKAGVNTKANLVLVQR